MSFDKHFWKPNQKQALFLSLPITIKEGFYGGGAGSGKLLPLDTLIVTSNGMIPIKDIHSGDLIIGKDGLEKLVIAETENHFDEQLYKLTFGNNEIIYCGANHLWNTWTEKDRSSKTDEARIQRKLTRINTRFSFKEINGHGNQGKIRTDLGIRNSQRVIEPYNGTIRNTKELFETRYSKRGGPNHSIEICKPIQFKEKELPIDPYILGCWLGDGTSASGNITLGHQDQLDFAYLFGIRQIRINSRKDNDRNQLFNIEGLSKLLIKNNLKNNKHIPEIYFISSEKQRRELVQGLMDTDGHCYDSGQAEFCNTNLKLIHGMFRLISSLGIKAEISKAWNDGNPNHKQAYYVKWINPYPVFKLERKIYKLPTQLSTKSRFHYIENIEEVENQLGKCIQVEDNEFLVSEACIPTHNSDVLLVYGIAHKWHEHPSFKQVFMRRTYPDLKKEIVPRSREIYSKFGATFNQTDMVWTFKRPDEYGGTGMGNRGAMIFLGHCEEEKDVHNYDSMEISLFTPDELTNSTEYIYLYIAFERNRSPKDSGLPSITRGAGMPGGIGHTFVKKRFVDPFPSGGKIIVGRGGNKRIYIHATLEDNKDNIDPTYSQSLDGRPEAEKKAKKYGDWSAYLGQVFDEFRDKKYPDEPANAIHTCEPFDIPSWWPKLVIGDWGFAAMTYIGFYAVSPNKRLYLYRELSFIKTKITEWAPIVKDFIDRENPRLVKFCKSAGQDRGQEHTIQQQISESLNHSIELSNNSPGSRVAGKMLLHEYLRWRPKPIIPQSEMPIYSEEYAMWLMRNKGLIEYKNYLSLFDPPKVEDNIPKLQIFLCNDADHSNHVNCCPIMIDSIKACSYDKKSSDGKAAEDVAEFDGDDPYDDIRYACDSAERYFNESVDEFEKVQKQEKMLEILKNTQDWTAYYRNMNVIESSQKPMQVVRRFHSGRR